MKAYYDSKPTTLEAVGDGSFRYRWNIKQLEISDPSDGELTGGSVRTAWQCDEVIVWEPMTTEKVIGAVIRSKYSSDEEMRLINDYNAYQQGATMTRDIVAEYQEYLTFTANARATVMADFGESQPTVEPVLSEARICDVVKFCRMTVNTVEISDKDALAIKSVYPAWESLIGESAAKGMKLQYNNKLWKVLQNHTIQEQWKPGTGTESLYTEVVESTGDVEVGTKENPIPYNNNMELENGKYYSQNGVVYKCTRDTGQPVYNNLADLINLYVVIAD